MKQYHDLLRSILAHGSQHQDRTGVGTISHFGFQTRFDLRQGFPIVTTKKVPFRWVAEELFWFLTGDTNEANLRARGVDIWAEWADNAHTSRFGREAGDLGPVYGYLWRSFGGHYPDRDGVDQIARLIKEIQTNPNSRRLIVTGWDPRYADNVDLPPCHTLFQFKIAEGKTFIASSTSSADAFLGVPFNISSYALLVHMIASSAVWQWGFVLHPRRLSHLPNHLDQVRELLPVSRGLCRRVLAKACRYATSGLLDLRYEHLNRLAINRTEDLAPVV
jgi:thymidylate synthase